MKLSLFVLSFCILHSLAAQQECEHIYFHHLGSVDGLSQNSVTKILQDHQGFIWLSTQSGLDKYLGVNFVTASGLDKSLFEQVTYLYDWNDTTVLLCTNRRNILVHKWEYKASSHPFFDSLNNILHIAKLEKGDGYLVFSKFQISLSKSKQKDIISLWGKSKKDTILQVCPVGFNNDFFFTTTDRLLRYQFNNGGMIPIKNGNYEALYQDGKYLYFSGQSDWIFRLELKQPSKIDSFQFVSKNRSIISALMMDDEGTLWVGTKKDGLFLFNSASLNQKWNNTTEVTSSCQFNAAISKEEKICFSSNGIYFIYKSSDGVIWVGTEEGGLNIWQWRKQVFDPLLMSEKDYLRDEDKLFNSNVWSIFAEPKSNELVLGLKGEGIALINKEGKMVTKRLKGVDRKGNDVLVIKRAGEKVYLGTLDGLYAFNWAERNNMDRYSPLQIKGSPVCKDKVTAIEFFETNNKWLIGGRGNKHILTFDANFGKRDTIRLPNNDVFSFALKEKSGQLLAGCEKGLYQINVTDRSYSIFPESRGTHFLCALQSGDTLWAGSGRKGLFCFSIKEKRLIRKYSLPKEEVIYDIFQDGRGFLWFSTNHGIYRFSPILGTFNCYGIPNGLKIYEYNSGAAAQDLKTGKLYFGGINGLNYFTPFSNTVDSLYYKPVLQCKYGSNETFVIDVKKIKDYYMLPYKFGYIDITPLLAYYQDAKNNQFIAIFNGDTLSQTEDGHYLIIENLFNSYFPLFGGENHLEIWYGYGDSDKLYSANIKFRKIFLSGTNRLYLLLFSLLGFIAFLVIRAFSESNKLKKLHQRINEISHITNSKEIREKALAHLTKDLEYEYATLALIDFDKRIIETKDVKDHKLDAEQINFWKKESIYPLDSDDILALVARRGEMALLIANKFIEPDTYELQESTLNESIAQTLNHQNLARMFMPIVHRFTPTKEQATTEEGTVVLGVVEVGFRMSEIQNILAPMVEKIHLPAYKFINITDFLKYKQTRLQLYVDNLAQSYYKALLKEQKESLNLFIEEIKSNADKRGFQHREFLHYASEQLALRIGADYTNIGLRSFNHEQISPFSQDLVYGYDLIEARKHSARVRHKNQNKTGIINHVLATKRTYFTGDAPKDDNYMEAIPDVRSEIAFPMILQENGSIIGVCNLMSKRPNFFNQIHAELYLKGVKKITDIYFQKKQYESLQKISKPSDIFALKEEGIYTEIANILKEYFHTDFVAVWKRNAQNVKSFTLLKESTGLSFYNMYRRFDFMEAEITEEAPLDNNMVVNYVDQIKNKRSRIFLFCKERGFKSYIVLYLISDDKYQAFINIFSKRIIEKEEIQGYNKTLLSEIMQKAHAVGMSIRVVKAINTISKSFIKREKKSPLQTIVDQAYYLAPSADSVVLFTYTENNPIIISDAIVGGKSLPYEDQANPNKRANVANYIIKHGTKYIADRNMYENVTADAGKARPFEQTFWHKRGLKSVAAIRLEFEDKPVGVMLFNYTEKKDFSEGGNNTRQFIEAFANFATTALLNDRFIERLQSTRDKIGQQLRELAERQINLRLEATQLQRDKEAAQVKLTEAESLMEQILPRAAGASFFLVMQGVNHDIRTLLIEAQIDLDELRTSIPEKYEAIVSESVNAISDIAQKVTNLLKLFDPGEQIVLEFVSIKAIVEQVIFFFNKGKTSRIHILNEISDALPDLKCNKSEFSMVIYNLVKNAVQAIPKDTQGQITVKADLKDKNYLITVKDDGVGIENEKQKDLFKLRYTTKEGGLGIGLFFVKETIEKKLEGRIWVDSKKGKGAIFYVEIPQYINFKK